MTTYSVDWWLEHLENVRPVGNGYTALCPAHDDHQNSLSIRATGDGGTLINCFSGCRYGDILEGVVGNETPIRIRSRSSRNGKASRSRITARDWWEVYTQIPAGEWEVWGARFTSSSVIFGWTGLATEKHRAKDQKKFSWTPEGSTRPPLWPSIPNTLPDRIFITEGESDCGTLRHLGFTAFGLTKGATSVASFAPVWRALYNRGVRDIVFTSDLDSAGRDALATVVSQLEASRISSYTINLDHIVDHLLGEKDLRDVWLRLKNENTLRHLIETNIVPISLHADIQRVSMTDFMGMAVPTEHWLVENVLAQESVGMIVGSPKLGKSWLSLDLGLSIATGRPFLGRFPTQSSGAVVYISKEDPAYSLQDRMGKILISKGISGNVSTEPGTIHLKFANTNYPFYVDLTRGFLFSPDHVDELIAWLQSLQRRVGQIACVMFDPILRMISGVDEFKASEVNQAIFDPATRIIQELGASVLLVHHRTKGAQTGKGSYGSIAFHAFSDSTIYLYGNEPDVDGWVPAHSEFKSAPEFSWAYRFLDLDDTYDVAIKLGTSGDLDVQDVEAQILEELKTDIGKSVGEIRDQLEDLTLIQVKQILRKLERDEKIYRRIMTEDEDIPYDLWFLKEKDK